MEGLQLRQKQDALSLGKTGGALGSGLACKSRKRDTLGTGEILETQSCIRCWLPSLGPALSSASHHDASGQDVFSASSLCARSLSHPLYWQLRKVR